MFADMEMWASWVWGVQQAHRLPSITRCRSAPLEIYMSA